MHDNRPERIGSARARSLKLSIALSPHFAGNLFSSVITYLTPPPLLISRYFHATSFFPPPLLIKVEMHPLATLISKHCSASEYAFFFDTARVRLL